MQEMVLGVRSSAWSKGLPLGEQLKKIAGHGFKYVNVIFDPDQSAAEKKEAVEIFRDLGLYSGQMGVDEKVQLAGPDIESQTLKAIENMERALAAADATLRHVVKVNIFITDAADFAGFNKVYAEKFGAPFPARATVITALLIPGAKVEIEAIAVAP